MCQMSLLHPKLKHTRLGAADRPRLLAALAVELVATSVEVIYQVFALGFLISRSLQAILNGTLAQDIDIDRASISKNPSITNQRLS